MPKLACFYNSAQKRQRLQYIHCKNKVEIDNVTVYVSQGSGVTSFWQV